MAVLYRILPYSIRPYTIRPYTIRLFGRILRYGTVYGRILGEDTVRYGRNLKLRLRSIPSNLHNMTPYQDQHQRKSHVMLPLLISTFIFIECQVKHVKWKEDRHQSSRSDDRANRIVDRYSLCLYTVIIPIIHTYIHTS